MRKIMNNSSYDRITNFLEQGRQEKLFPCGYLEVLDKTTTIAQWSVGQIPDSQDEPTSQTRFDLASLTKVVATLPAILLFMEAGELTPQTTLGEKLPATRLTALAPITVNQLLTHTAGLPSHERFYEQTERDVLRAILAVPFNHQPGERVVYSDLGFMLLGKLVEELSGQSLNDFCQEKIFEPLGMKQTSFSPTGGVPTRVKGAPDDGNARFFKEALGHAGLFSTSEDLASYLRFWQRNFQNKKLYQEATTYQTKGQGDCRGWGWVKQTGSHSFFAEANLEAFGHTGYTGTSIFWDPKWQEGIVFLTNRVYNSTDARFVDYRKQLHRIIFEEFARDNKKA